MPRARPSATRLLGTAPDAPALAALREWTAVANQLVVVILSAATADNAARLQRLETDFTEFAGQAAGAAAGLGQGAAAEIDEIQRTLVRYGAGQNGIFAVRQAQLGAASDVSGALLTTRQVAARFIALADMLLSAIQAQVQDRGRVLRAADHALYAAFHRCRRPRHRRRARGLFLHQLVGGAPAAPAERGHVGPARRRLGELSGRGLG